MSQFLREFEKLLGEQEIKVSGSAVFEEAGLDRSMLSRIRAGALLEFSHVPSIASAIENACKVKNDMIYLRLLRARLQDECVADERADRINIEITGQLSPEATRQLILRDIAQLPPKDESAIRNIIANLALDADLRRNIRWLGNDLFAPRPETNSKLDPAVVKGVIDAAAADARGGKSPPPPSAPPAGAKPVKYPSARRSRKHK